MSVDVERTENIGPPGNPVLENHLQAALHCDHPRLWLFLLQTLAKGNPVAQMSIASALGISLSDVQAQLHAFADTEYDDDGKIVACGLSLLPTPHRFQVNGRNLYTWCALDSLMYPVALQQTAQVESLCPVSGVAVRLTITPTGVTFLNPAGAAVSMVIPAAEAGCCSVRTAFCRQVHFMSSSMAADAWRSMHPEAMVLSVAEAWRLGSAIAHRRLADARSGMPVDK